MPANLENSAVATGKGQFSFQSQRKKMPKKYSHASKVMFKILQARLQQHVNRDLPDVQDGFRKGRGTEIKLPTSAGLLKKQKSSRKTSICFIDYAKAFDCVDHHKLKNSERDWNTRPSDLPLEKPICMSGSNS